MTALRLQCTDWAIKKKEMLKLVLQNTGILLFSFFLLLCVLSVMMYYSELHGVLPFPSLTSRFCCVTVIITYAKQAYLRTDCSSFLFTECYCLYYLLMLSYIISETTLHIWLPLSIPHSLSLSFFPSHSLFLFLSPTPSLSLPLSFSILSLSPPLTVSLPLSLSSFKWGNKPIMELSLASYAKYGRSLSVCFGLWVIIVIFTFMPLLFQWKLSE